MGPQPPCWSTSGPWLLPAIAAEKLPGAQTMTSSLGSAALCMANLRGAVVTQQYLGSHSYCHTRAFHFTSYCQLLQKLQGMENKRGEVSDSEALGSNAVLLKMDLLTTLDQQILQFIFVVLIFMPILTLKYGRGWHLGWGGMKPSDGTRLTQELFTGRPLRPCSFRSRQLR